MPQILTSLSKDPEMVLHQQFSGSKQRHLSSTLKDVDEQLMFISVNVQLIRIGITESMRSLWPKLGLRVEVMIDDVVRFPPELSELMAIWASIRNEIGV